jgi:hypothetical protein
MPNQIRIDRRVLYSFMMIMTVLNAVIIFIPWKEIMVGKNDFPVFYSSAQMVSEGQASRLYDFNAENSFVHRISDVTRAPNNHLPYELLIFIPFSHLKFGIAHILWTLLNLIILAAIALIMHDIWPKASNVSLTFLTLLAFFPVCYCLLQGQDSILLLFLFVMSFWFSRRGQDDAAGFVLAFGLFRPQLVLPFALVAFLAGKWKFVRGFIPGAFLAVALSTWVVGFHGMAEYARVLISQGTQNSAVALAERWQVHPGLMPTLRGFLWMSLPSSVPGIIQAFLLLAGVSLGLSWAATRIRSAKDEATLDLAFALAVAASVLVSYHSFLHDFSLIILPVLIVSNLVPRWTRLTQRGAYSIVMVGFLLFLTPLYLVLLVTAKLGFLILPTIAGLWMVRRWGAERPLKVPARGHQASISQPAV